jgi:hypothetical protein
MYVNSTSAGAAGSISGIALARQAGLELLPPAAGGRFLERAIDIRHQSFFQRQLDSVGQLVKIAIQKDHAEQFNAGHNLVGKTQLKRTCSVPMFTRSNQLQIHIRSILGNGSLEQ